ncbi:MAG: hypothetical protein A2W25_02880 [candidate division Zixibacteria bacterium RBG_16_53_22]|nr:MAG: hypothetical protein A2W25_02880 [candidate division Zixibacteria bacterium RBG_16_53_22]
MRLTVIMLVAALSAPVIGSAQEGFNLIYGNRDASRMTVMIGDSIQFPVWVSTPPGWSEDTIAFMSNTMQINSQIISQILWRGCTLCDSCCSFYEPPPFFCPTLYTMYPINTAGDTIQIGYYLFRLTSDPWYIGQTVCPIGLCPIPSLWGNIYGTVQFLPLQSSSCLYFSPGCDVIGGDANGNGAFDGLDVTYSVAYLKGLGAAPPNSCECPPHGPVYAAADANGDCQFNGIDVTFMVAYLKGVGSAPRSCPDC